MTATRIEAPTDAQLAYIFSLCREHAIPPPDAVASKQEASAIIEAMRAGRYDHNEYSYPWGVPFR